MEEKKANIEIKSCFLSITIDKTMKESFTDLCKKNGLDFSYANALFIKQCLKIDDIPFENDQMSNNKKGKQKKIPFDVLLESVQRKEMHSNIFVRKKM